MISQTQTHFEFNTALNMMKKIMKMPKKQLLPKNNDITGTYIWNIGDEISQNR